MKPHFTEAQEARIRELVREELAAITAGAATRTAEILRLFDQKGGRADPSHLEPRQFGAPRAGKLDG